LRYQVNPGSQELERSEVEQLKAELRRLQKENETLRIEREILKKNDANLLRASQVEKYSVIKQSQAEFGVKSLCRVLKVSRSGYYNCLGRADSEWQKANAVLKGKIRKIWERKRQIYGYPRVWAEL
jgi:putative transposase